MKKILLLLVVTFLNTVLTAQNNNLKDCYLKELKSEFNTIDQESEYLFKNLTNFITDKEKLKQDHENYIKNNHSNTNSKAEDYTSFVKSFQEIRFYEFSEDASSVIFNNSTRSNIINIIDIIKRNNLDTLKMSIKLKNVKITDFKNVNLIDSIELQTKSSIYIDSIANQEDNKLYKLNRELFRAFRNSLYAISNNNFNTCLTRAYNNITILQDDLNKAENKLNEITSKELYELKFKKNITLIVGVLIAIILICFFVGTLYKANEVVKQKLLGEAGLQFITIFVIIIAVILFGVMNILKGSELAAILSAIAGYILGKTAPPKSDKALEMELETLRLEKEKAERLQKEKLEAEQKAKDEKAAREAEETRLAKEAADKAEAERIAIEEAEKVRLAEEARLAEEKRLADETEKKRLEDEANQSNEENPTDSGPNEEK